MSEKMKIALLGVSHWHLPLYLLGLPENSLNAMPGSTAALHIRITVRW